MLHVGHDRWSSALVLGSMLLVLLSPVASADEPQELVPLEIVSLELAFELRDAVAATHMTLVVRNNLEEPAEVSLRLPLSEHAVLTKLTLTTHNRTLEGTVAERKTAQVAYETSKERGEDAVLVDSAGDGLLGVRLNAAPGETLTLDADYAELVPMVRGVREYVFPAGQVATLLPRIDHFRLDGSIYSRAAWSSLNGTGLPTSPMASGTHTASWIFDADDFTASRDIVLRLKPTLSTYEATMVLSANEGEGSFAATVLPPGFGVTPLPVDVVFVLDHSGSMEGDKIVQAKEALATILHELRSQDHWGLVSFDDDVDRYASTLESVDAARIQDGQAWISEVQADGSTDIEAGISAALTILGAQERAAVPMVVLITDGLPTSGITVHRDIIASFEQKNQIGARLHVVGIGFDQDNAFLSELASSQRGFYRGLGPEDDVASSLEDFYSIIASPVLKDIEVEFLGLDAREIHPDPLPDLYIGSELVVAGRANLSDLPDVIVVKISGESASGPFERTVDIETSSMPVRPEVDRLWARQKANTFEHYIALNDGYANVSQTYADLLAHGLAHQIETRVTSWVIVPLDQDVPVEGEPWQNDESAMDSYATGAQSAPNYLIPPAAPPGAPPAAPPGGPVGDMDQAQKSGGGAGDAVASSATPGPSLVLLMLAALVGLALRARRSA